MFEETDIRDLRAMAADPPGAARDPALSAALGTSLGPDGLLAAGDVA